MKRSITFLVLLFSFVLTSLYAARDPFFREGPPRTQEGWRGQTGRFEEPGEYGRKSYVFYRALRDVCRAHYCPIHFRDRPNVISVYRRKVLLCSDREIEKALPYLHYIPRPYAPNCAYCPDCERVVAMEYEYGDEEEDGTYCYPIDDCDCMGCGCGRDAEYEFDECWNRGAWYYGYFLKDYHQYYPFFLDHLQFCAENPKCRDLWPEYLTESSTINDMAYRTFSSLISEELLDGHYPPSWAELDDHEKTATLVCYPAFYSHYDQLCQDVCNYIDQTCLYPERSSEAITNVRAFLDSTHPLYLSMYSRCIENYPHPRLYWERSLIHYHRGETSDFLDDIRSLIDATGDSCSLLDSAAYAKQGEMYLLACSFEEAVTALTTAIAKDPHNKEAYFLRAQAYFELGDFEHSFADFLGSGYHSTPISGALYISFASGLITGSVRGVTESFCELAPSLLTTVHGLANGIWAFAVDPIEVSREVIDTAVNLFNFLYTHTTEEILSVVSPEIANLIRNWKSLSPFQRGDQIGFVIGKYGIDILALEGTVAGIKYYKALRNANAMATLEIAASRAPCSQRALELSAQFEKKRMAFLKGRLIEMDKQGKHIKGHRNFIEKGKSIWTHEDPQGLYDRFAGTGRLCRGEIFGEAGSKEIVDFGEIVGKIFTDDQWIETSWGQIHYSKNGAHIVPHIIVGGK
jgi:tetratricopeptide (TPR) repeat protein